MDRPDAKGRTEGRVHVANLGRVLQMSASAELALEGTSETREYNAAENTRPAKRESLHSGPARPGEPQHSEPPDADPHVRWCGREVEELSSSTPYPDPPTNCTASSSFS